MNLVGLSTDRPSALDPDGRWSEAIPTDRLSPANFHEAQLNRRPRRNNTPSGKE
jgi:hypothetical protein